MSSKRWIRLEKKVVATNPQRLRLMSESDEVDMRGRLGGNIVELCKKNPRPYN